MATISRTGITTGGTISPTHITNIIDALDGTSASTTIIASGSFSGSLTGRATNATSASYATTASYATAVSTSISTQNLQHNVLFVDTSGPGTIQVDGGLRYNPNTDLLTTTSSYATQALSASYASPTFPFTGSAIISGSLRVTGSLNISAGITGSHFGTSSYATNALSASYAPGGGTTFPYVGTAQITGSLFVSGSANTITLTGENLNLNTPKLDGSVLAKPSLIVNFADIANSGGAGKFVVPLNAPISPTAGTLYWDDANATLYIYQDAGGGAWRSMAF